MITNKSSLKRRQILSGLMKLLVFIGLIFVSIPFISSLSTNTIDEKLKSDNRWVVSFPVAELVEGKVNSIKWSGGVFWIYRRTLNDIELLQQKDDLLRDALSTQSDQPEQMENKFRSANEQIFVFIPIENKKGCQVRLIEDQDKTQKNSIFSEPCFGAKYDAAGRILKMTGDKQQKNLAVPNHRIEDGILRIGVWTPKISL